MTIDALIEKLRRISEKHGDLEVFYDNSRDGIQGCLAVQGISINKCAGEPDEFIVLRPQR